MGRPAQPVSIIQAVKKSHHISKAEAQHRKEMAIKLGECGLRKLVVPDSIKNDLNAMKHWDATLKEYMLAAVKGHEILTSADVGVLALYCKAYSEYDRLLLVRESVFSGACELDDVCKIEGLINRKMDSILKMQDRLFLNPLARIRNIPKRDKAPVRNEMIAAGFDI